MPGRIEQQTGVEGLSEIDSLIVQEGVWKGIPRPGSENPDDPVSGLRLKVNRCSTIPEEREPNRVWE